MSDQQGKLEELKAEHQGLKYHRPSWRTAAGHSSSTSYYMHFFSVINPRLPFLHSKSRKNLAEKMARSQAEKTEQITGERFRKD